MSESSVAPASALGGPHIAVTLLSIHLRGLYDTGADVFDDAGRRGPGRHATGPATRQGHHSAAVTVVVVVRKIAETEPPDFAASPSMPRTSCRCGSSPSSSSSPSRLFLSARTSRCGVGSTPCSETLSPTHRVYKERLSMEGRGLALRCSEKFPLVMKAGKATVTASKAYAILLFSFPASLANISTMSRSSSQTAM